MGSRPAALVGALAAATLATGVAYAGASGPWLEGLAPAAVLGRVPGAIARQHSLELLANETVTSDSVTQRESVKVAADLDARSYDEVRVDDGGAQEQRLVGKRLYVSLSESAVFARPIWFDASDEVPMAETDFPGLGLGLTLSRLTGVRGLGHTTVRGARAVRVAGTLPRSAVGDLLSGVGGSPARLQPVTGLTAGVELDVAEDGLPVREVVHVTLTDAGVTAQYVVSEDYRFGVPVQVVKPPASEIQPDD